MNEKMVLGELRPVFNFGFNNRLVKSGGSVGIFDESGRQQIVVATDANKILLQSTESVFHLIEAITCIDTCRLPSDSSNDPRAPSRPPLDGVIVGTKTTLTLFDIFHNRTVFHREMPEGINCLRVGVPDEYSEELILCGCGTTIWGLQRDGSDAFWTALGDEVNVLELCDMDGDGRNELIVGSNGMEIKVFKNASFWAEYDEGDPCIALCATTLGGFAFGLASGVVGVYASGERCWRIKTKSQVISLHAFPNPSFVLCVWKNCKVDVRGAESGEIHIKEQIGDGVLVVDSFLSDINGVGSNSQLTVIFGNGQVRGFEIGQENEPNASIKESEKLMREYGQRKHNLLSRPVCKNAKMMQAVGVKSGKCPI